MADFDHTKIEKKWQRKWAQAKIYKAADKSKKPKYYVLDMFPYPSGSAMHVGHCKGYIASDVMARLKMMQGFNVLHPMGWDAFGLPAENFAIKNKIHPAKAVAQNVKTFKKQLGLVGFTYDWGREINTTDPNYYKWTQWQFKKMFEAGLVRSVMDPVNYCPSCKTVLANEDVEDGKCERCSTVIERKPIREWEILITRYADRLLSGLDNLDWEESILEMQRNWIGKSEGAEIAFKVKPSGEIKIFTTRLDTIFGCTYCVVAPEHPILESVRKEISNLPQVEEYIKASRQKSDLERTDLIKEKTGVEIKGIKAINPFTKEEIPVFVGDYVLGHYGTGAIMAVPAHDARDFEFAKKHNLPVKEVVLATGVSKQEALSLAFCDDGILFDSKEFSGLRSVEARQKMAEFAQKNGFGQKTVNYKMRDWIFARQRYWGEPIPLVYCQHCADKIKSGKYKKGEFSIGELANPGWIAVPDKDLPIKLPSVKSYEPAGDGQSPLANIKSFVETKCPKCKGKARRETNTMPQWAGSCWYYLRYIDPKNQKAFADLKKEKYWSPVDLYIGGAEHATRHLLYARFWHKFLFDIKAVNYPEPFKKLQHVGLILGADNQKMSKRWSNVVNPDDVVKEYGADALRLYEMFMGPFGESIAWSQQGVVGCKRFLDKVVRFKGNVEVNKKFKTGEETVRKLHQIIKKVSEDIEQFKFNTAIAGLMGFMNDCADKKIAQSDFLDFLKLLAPFAPHLTEEFFQESVGGKKFISIFQTTWPKYDAALAKESSIKIPVQINGKVRATIEVSPEANQAQVELLAKSDANIKKWLNQSIIKKVIYVPKKILNIII
ncbi:MAG: leucine--tRNA ligase [Candidatus Paceibacterota bacterium]